MIEYTPLKSNMEGPKMMVWKMYLLLNMAIFAIHSLVIRDVYRRDL